MGMDYIGPFTFSAGRLFLGFLTLFPIFLFFELKKVKKINLNYKKVFIYFIFISFLLSYGNSLQQFALLLTDVANAAVYTILSIHCLASVILGVLQKMGFAVTCK